MKDGVVESRHLHVLNAVLRVAATHSSLLAPAAFRELAQVLSQHVPSVGLVALVPEGDAHLRIYVNVTNDLRPSPFGFGSRVPLLPHVAEIVLQQGRPFVCDDSAHGSEIARLTSKVGFQSHIIVPIKAAKSARVAGGLAWLFSDVGGASQAPLDLLTAVADILALTFERNLRVARKRRLAMILETSGDAMFAWDCEGRLTDANAAAGVLTGLSRDELLGRDIASLFDPPPGRKEQLPPPDTRMTLVVRGADGREKRLSIAATMTAVEDDPVVACHALVRDLTAWEIKEREAVERLARIHELEEQHRTLLDNAPLIIFRLDPKTRELVYLNHCAERLLGVPREEALSTPQFLRELHADYEGQSAYDGAVAQAAAGLCSSPYEARLSRHEGGRMTARGTIYPLLGQSGNLAAIEGLFMDVSAEHAARTRLIQADRLTTLGTLAAGVAHEINNPAAFILLGLDMLGRMLDKELSVDSESSHETRSMLSELRDSTRRIVEIVRDLRMFARAPGGTRRIAVDVNRTVESALTLTRGQIVERADVVRDLGDVPNVLIDEGRLGQVLVNLLVNAAQAIPRGGRGEAKVYVATRSHDGRTVEIEIRDTGVGILTEMQERIWDPFFTTKDPGAGTGLGLSISREIIDRSGGRLYVESPVPGTNPPGGSRFIIELPTTSAALSAPPSGVPSWAPRSIGGAAKVLIIEDESSLARALASELGRVHEVVVAANASEAMQAWSKKSFDVIFCDVRMPVMTGEALFEMVRQERPDIAARFVFMTGVGFGANFERFLSESGRPILEKPFSVEDALDIIRKVVSKHGRAP